MTTTSSSSRANAVVIARPLPRRGSSQTSAPAALATAAVESDEPLSTTRIRASGNARRKSPTTSAMPCSSSRHGMRTARLGRALDPALMANRYTATEPRCQSPSSSSGSRREGEPSTRPHRARPQRSKRSRPFFRWKSARSLVARSSSIVERRDAARAPLPPTRLDGEPSVRRATHGEVLARVGLDLQPAAEPPAGFSDSKR